MMTGTTQPLQHLRDWLHRNALALRLDRTTIRSTQPGVVTAITTDADLIRFEVTMYPPGTW